jgi:peptide/nickel transport system permease protein
MTQYIQRRLIITLPILLGLTLITFILTELMPGDFVDAMVPPEQKVALTTDQLRAIREAYGLDKPAPVRYVLWLSELARGNLGHSLRSGQPVLGEILERLPATLQLTVTALLFGIVTGTTLGLISAIKQYSWLDQVLTVLGFIWISTPGFVFAIGGIVLLSLKLHLVPTSGIEHYGESAGLLTRLHYLILPAAVLGLSDVAGFMRYARSSLLDVIRQEYITAARAKGLDERRVLMVHALRNALIPLITVIGLSVPGLLGGAVIIESIFAWPGMGTYSLAAIASRDYPSILGVTCVASCTVLLSNLVTDIAYGIADPRIRYVEA